MRENNYIDLGLPSGTLWATCNVGAESIVGYGDYFTHKEAMECDITLPTREQFRELNVNTKYVWVENYNNCGVNGKLFIGKNGNEVFFPASGCFRNGRTYHLGHCGYYWTSPLFSDKNHFKYWYFSNYSAFGMFTDSCYYGFTLRAVKNC